MPDGQCQLRGEDRSFSAFLAGILAKWGQGGTVPTNHAYSRGSLGPQALTTPSSPHSPQGSSCTVPPWRHPVEHSQHQASASKSLHSPTLSMGLLPQLHQASSLLTLLPSVPSRRAASVYRYRYRSSCVMYSGRGEEGGFSSAGSKVLPTSPPATEPCYEP